VGRLGGGFMLFLLLMVVGYHASAQNTGASPYINSWHTYRVLMGSSANSYEWDITNASSTDTTHLYPGSHSWASVILVGSNNDISLFFDDVVFDPGQTWELLYREFASGSCVAARKFTIQVSENNFYLTLDANDTICKVESGDVFNWNDVDNEPFNTVFTYRVTLHKESGFIINNWSFSGDIVLSMPNHNFVSYTIAVVPVGVGTATLSDAPTNLDGTFSVVSSSALSPPTVDGLSVDITVTLSGLLHDGVTATLTIHDGQVTHGVNSNITFDNEGRPTQALDGVTDILLQDRKMVVVVNPLPATQNILEGEGETVWSAQHPLQNSKHRYTVLLGEPGNYNNAGTAWSIKTSGGLDVTTGFTSARTSSATNDTLSITFTDLMLTGNYVLYYTEFGDNGCSAVREYPFTLGDPFDVDLAAVNSICAAASGQIFTDLTASATTINYSVTQNSVNYDAAWSFDFTLNSNPVFAAADVDVTSISVTTPGVTYTSIDSYSGTVEVPAMVTSVTISVTYNGYYVNEHSITAALLNITGSHNEVDEDADDSNVHVIYSMPQVTALAGVE
jgi:hypothetical protein